MPQMADFNVINYAGTTKSFTSISPAGGDRVPARWRIEDTAVPANCRVTLEVSSRWNGKRDARHCDMKLVVPWVVVDSTTSSYKVLGNVLFSGTLVRPMNLPDSVVDDALRFLCDAMYKGKSATPTSVPPMDAFRAGYAPV